MLAHVPDLHDFVGGLRALLAESGVLTMEFPHLLRLIEERQFDTIYHEHFSYLSLIAVERLFREHDLELFDVEELRTHGGSLRVYAAPAAAGRARAGDVDRVLAEEEAPGLKRLEIYDAFDREVRAVKRELLGFLIAAAADGPLRRRLRRRGEGQHAPELLRRPARPARVRRRPQPAQAGTLPPRNADPDPRASERIAETRPDYVLILPWNLREEIAQQMSWIREWGGRFVVPIPTVAVL